MKEMFSAASTALTKFVPWQVTVMMERWHKSRKKTAKESERKEGERKQVGDVMGTVQLCADSFVNSPRTPSCLALIDS